MIDLLREIFTSNAGSFGFVFALFMVIFYAIYKITKFKTSIEVEHGTFGKRVDKIEANTDHIKEEIIKIKGLFASNFPSFDPYLQSQSPVRLTSKGITVAQEINIESRIANNWNHIFEFIDESVTNKNAYDIQQFCIEQATVNLSSLLTKIDVNEIKLYAFKTGKPVEAFGGVIGITIRDAYFKHKGIDVLDVDKHDPDKQHAPK